jgi:hypothetical protein
MPIIVNLRLDIAGELAARVFSSLGNVASLAPQMLSLESAARPL